MNENAKNQNDRRSQNHKTMIKEGLRKPGVREVMEVYRNWQHTDSGLNTFRSATKESFTISTTDHANAE